MTTNILDELKLTEADTSARSLFAELLANRRSAKHLSGGELSAKAIEAVGRAIQLTPAAFNTPPWQVILLTEKQDAFWDMLAAASANVLEGDRLERQLARFDNFRDSAGIALVYERVSVESELMSTQFLSPRDARSFVDQALGMVQLSIWLTLVEFGFATSLQHWGWLAESEIAAFVNANPVELRLVVVMPIGRVASPPPPVDRPAVESGFCLECLA